MVIILKLIIAIVVIPLAALVSIVIAPFVHANGLVLLFLSLMISMVPVVVDVFGVDLKNNYYNPYKLKYFFKYSLISLFTLAFPLTIEVIFIMKGVLLFLFLPMVQFVWVFFRVKHIVRYKDRMSERILRSLWICIPVSVFAFLCLYMLPSLFIDNVRGIVGNVIS